MRYKVFDITKFTKWYNYLSKLPIAQQDIYFTPDYYELYEENGDGKAKCFVFEKNGDIALYPFLINSVNELGYDLNEKYYDIQGAYGYNGIISSSYEKSFIKNFYDAFADYCNKENIIAEFTRFHPLIDNQKFSNNYMNVIFDRKTIFIDLADSYENIFRNVYSSNNRNMIRKGRKTLNVNNGQDNKELNKFIKIYKYTMKKVGANSYYLFSEKYFNSLLNQHFHLINVYNKNKLLGSMIVMIYKIYAHYHLSGRSKDCTNNAVNNFMLDESIKFSKTKNCKYFHLGGGNTSKENDGLFRFKKNFSKNFADFYIGKKIHNKRIYNNVKSQWKDKHPESFQKNKQKLLGYRDINNE